MVTNEEVRNVVALGRRIDLSHCHYGLFHDGKTYLQTSPYYYFLAGLVRSSGARNIIEIGTYRGGSTKALGAGVENGAGKVVTYDVKNFEPDFSQSSGIKPFVGDPLSTEAMDFAKQEFPDGVDLLFVDGVHDGMVTLAQTLAYERIFRPAWIVCDDVNLNPSMRQFMTTIAAVLPGARDISTDHPDVRRPSEGFAVWKRAQ